MKNILFLAIFIVAASCSAPEPEGTTYWINSFKVECTGVAQRACLQIQTSDTIETGQWKNFYASIEGFEYEPGYTYHLRVHEKQLDEQEVPADASSIKYTLEEIITKKPDSTLRINDIWALEEIKGDSIDISGEDTIEKRPRLEFNLRKMRLMGTNGCNSLTGNIEQIDANTIALDYLAVTSIACLNMKIPDIFNEALNNVDRYKIQDRALIMFDTNGNEVLRFKKVD